MFVDLHLHTIHSDGKLSVKDTINIACAKQLDLIAVTDHDTTKGVNEAIEYAHSKKIHCISGIELSCRNEELNVDFSNELSIHILGYNIDYSSNNLQSYLMTYHLKRNNILNKLIGELRNNGLDIKYDDINVIAGKQMRIQDVINHINSCFMCNKQKEQYVSIADNYYPQLFAEDSSLKKAINLIQSSGGIAVLAHAFFSYKDYESRLNSYMDVRNLLDYLCDLGIDGVEAFYPKYTLEQSEFLQQEAKKRNLIVTAGSDFHGTPMRKNMMNFNIEQMKETYEFLGKVNRYA